jgi:heme/copper-type cytochrome/quinol oxidase subunit 2
MKKGIILLMLILVLTACNSNKNPSIPIEKTEKETGHILEIIAKNWTFHQQIYTVPAGKVTIELKNTEGFHGIHIEGTDITIEGDGTYTTELEPGEYTIVCSIVCGTGHNMMKAKLIVED